MTVLATIYSKTAKLLGRTEKIAKSPICQSDESDGVIYRDQELTVGRSRSNNQDSDTDEDFYNGRSNVHDLPGSGIRVTRIPSEAEKNAVIVRNLKKLLAEDKNTLTRHPSLKHLFERYHAVLNDTTLHGHPVAPVEPIRELVDRVDTLAVRQYQKAEIKKRSQQSRRRNNTQDSYDRYNNRR